VIPVQPVRFLGAKSASGHAFRARPLETATCRFCLTFLKKNGTFRLTVPASHRSITHTFRSVNMRKESER